MTCILLHASGYSSVFLGHVAGEKASELSCFKVYNKDFPLQPRHWLNISRECAILSQLQDERVDGVVQLLSVADTPKHFSLQFKPCFGGNLYQRLERGQFRDEHDLCSQVIIPLLHVLGSLHARGILHRDIKPENIFFEADGKLVLGDFGLAIDSKRDRPCSRVGTTEYMAPEVLAQPSADTVALRNIPASMLTPYTPAVDIWALGTLIHEALTGQLPFQHPDPAVMALKAQFGRATRLPHGVSAQCQDFVDAVLQKVPARRPTAVQLLSHPWMQLHQAAAAAAVAARVKAKVLAQLQMDSSPCSTGQCHTAVGVALCANSRTSGGAAAAAAGASVRNGTGVTAAAGQRDCLGSKSSSSSLSTSSSSNSSSSMCESSLEVGSPQLSSPLQDSCCKLVSSAGARTMQADQLQLLSDVPSASGCICSPRKVTFDCAELQGEQQAAQMASSDAAAAAAAMGAPVAAAEVPAAQHGGTHPSSAPGKQVKPLTQCGASRESAKSTSGSWSDQRSTAGQKLTDQQLLQLLPALSEPVLLEVTAQLQEQSDSVSKGVSSSAAACSCCEPRRTSQSGTCSAAVAAATASGANAFSWRFAGTKRAVASKRSTLPGVLLHAESADNPDGCSNEQAASAPHYADVPPSVTLGTRPSPGRVCRELQLDSNGGSTGLNPTAHGPDHNASATVKPPLLKASSGPSSVQVAGGAFSPKPPLLSPTRPALLMQRLRSFAKERSHALGNTAWHRRHSLDMPAGSASGTAAASCVPGSSNPAASSNEDAAACGSCPALLSPARPVKARPAAAGSAAGVLASPLVALCRLSGLWSPSDAAAAAGTAALPACPTGSQPCALAGSQSVEPKASCSTTLQSSNRWAAAGTAALLVGHAAPAGEAERRGQQHARALISPTGCGRRSAKGVCKKVINQVLRQPLLE